MKILFCSYLFAPSVGGVETVGQLLSEEFKAAGHEVRIVTNTPGASCADGVLRRPASGELLKAVRWADVVFHNNISLRYSWPLLLARKPWVIAHHTWLRRPDGGKGPAERLKELLLHRARNVAVSGAIAAELPVNARVIPNPYDPVAFHVRRTVQRARDLVFVGRLVSDKGADLLIDAVRQLHARGLACNLSIVGEGPELPALRRSAEKAALGSHLHFAGLLRGAELGEFLNRHRIMVMPSRWNEPFGVVALEGIARGCAVVGTRGGGLPAAIGPCGETVPNGDPAALADALERLLRNPGLISRYTSKAEAHLKQHHPATIAQMYLDLLEEARGS